MAIVTPLSSPVLDPASFRWTLCLLGSFRLQRETDGDGGRDRDPGHDAGPDFGRERDGDREPEVVLRFQDRKDDLLLAYLALFPRTALPRRQVGAALWPEKDRDARNGNLAYTLFNLRKRLQEAGVPELVLVGGRRSLQLQPGIATDLQQISALVLAAAKLGDSREAAPLLESAIALYGDGLLPGVEATWLEPERARLRLVHQEALRRLSQLLSPAGDPARMLATVATVGHPADALPSGPAQRGPSGPWVEEIADAAPAADAPTLPGDRARLLAFLREVEPHLGAARGGWALERVDAQYPLVRQLLERAIETRDLVFGLQVAGSLWRYWYERGRIDEGRGYLERLLAVAVPTNTPEYAKALHAHGTLAYFAGDLGEARRHLEQAARICWALGDDRGAARSLANRAMAASQAGAYLEAREAFAKSIELARTLDDTRALLARLLNAARNELLLSEPQRAGVLLQERLRLARAEGDERAIASSLAYLASADLAVDDYAAARDNASSALFHARAADDARWAAFAQRLLGETAQRQGQLQEAVTLQRESVRLARQSGDIRELAESLRYLAMALYGADQQEEAVSLMQQALELLQAVGDTESVRRARLWLQQPTAG